MKLHNINNQEDLQTVADRMWEIVLHHYPELVETQEKAVADPRLDRADLLHLGFTFGAAFALSEMTQGHIREANFG